MSRCTQDLRKAGVVYPRTCEECGLGPCKRYAPATLGPPPNVKSSASRSDVKTLRDEFAMAALTGMLASNRESGSSLISNAYSYADAMMSERAR